MKTVGLLVILVGGAAFWLIGIDGLTLDEFQQELANWLHIPVGGKQPGADVVAHPKGPTIDITPVPLGHPVS